jgi:hypothetical protein
MKRITIDRCSGAEEVSKENWKDLISALVLVGYEVYGDEGKVVFKLGYGDIIEEIEDENK